MVNMENKKEVESKNKVNWKLVLISFAIIALAYVAISGIMKIPDRVTAFCQFNTTIYDSAARDQCGIIKVVSSDINDVKIHEFEKFGKCSEKLKDLPECEGFETYHFSKYNLKDLCDKENCEVDGVICNAFFITYHNSNNSNRNEFEQKFFTEVNIESKEKLMQVFNDCDAGGWLPWQ